MQNLHQPEEGLSPDLLHEDEVRELATPNIVAVEEDTYSVMQIGTNHPVSDSNSSDWGKYIPGWNIDFQRILHAVIHCSPEQTPFNWMVTTWFLDPETSPVCEQSKIAWVGEDPADWDIEVTHPWRFQLTHETPVLFDAVLPTPPRARVEDHVAHIIITKPVDRLNSILLSLEFHHPTEADIFVRYAIAVPQRICQSDILVIVPSLNQIDASRIGWAQSGMDTIDTITNTRFGQCIRIDIEPESDASPQAVSDDITQLMQVQADVAITCKERPHVEPIVDSGTDEFLQANASANDAQDAEIHDERTLINVQNEFVQELWNRFEGGCITHSTGGRRIGRIESWFLHHSLHVTCHAPHITLIDDDSTRWENQIIETWQDRLAGRNNIEFAIAFPIPEDAASGVVAHVILTQAAIPDLKSAVVSIYDSEEDLARNPYSFALALPRRVDITAAIHNVCSLWLRRIPIERTQQVNVQAGNACRLVIGRGVNLDIPQLLTLDAHELRLTLQRAVHADIIDRPSEPSFVNALSATASLERARYDMLDPRPSWIPALERLFEQAITFSSDAGTQTFQVTTWYVNSETGHHCDRAHNASLSNETFMWRTDLVFPWRDRLMRATPMDLSTVDQLLPTSSQALPCPHVILAQGLNDGQHAVLIMVAGTGHPYPPRSQFAHVLLSRVMARDIIRLAVPEDLAHRSAVVQLHGRTYFFDDEMVIQTGNLLHVLLAAGESARNGVPQADEAMLF